MSTLTQILLGLMAGVPAILIAWLAYRSSKSTAVTQAAADQQAAALAASPAVQAQINSGFQYLLNERLAEIGILRGDLELVKGTLRSHTRYLQLTSAWHIEHVRDYDTPAMEIIREVAPHELPRLKLSPFPEFEENYDSPVRPHTQQAGPGTP